MNNGDLRRIQHIAAYCERIENHIKYFGKDFLTFCESAPYYDSVSMCILQIGELASSLTQEYRDETKNEIPWAQVRGMRNLLAHDYGAVDSDSLWNTIITDIPKLHFFCSRVIEQECRPSLMEMIRNTPLQEEEYDIHFSSHDDLER